MKDGATVKNWLGDGFEEVYVFKLQGLVLELDSYTQYVNGIANIEWPADHTVKRPDIPCGIAAQALTRFLAQFSVSFV